MATVTSPIAIKETKPGVLDRVLFVWGILRLALIGAAAYAFRHEIMFALEERVGLPAISEWVMGLVSTPYTRLLWFGGSCLLLTATAIASRRLSQNWICAIVTFVAAASLLVVVARLHMGRRYALAVLVILVSNILPERAIPKFLSRSPLMAALAGIGEVFFFRKFIEWLGRLLGLETLARKFSSLSVSSMIPGILMAAAALAVLLPGRSLLAFESALRRSDAVKVRVTGDVNWIALHPTRKYLYVSGHGLHRLQRYTLDDWTAGPLEADTASGRAQGFEYDPEAGEIYVYNRKDESVMYFSEDLRLRRTVPLPKLATGDPWVGLDKATDTLTIMSEADLQDGAPVYVIDRPTGKVRHTIYDAAPGAPLVGAAHLLTHPDGSRIYFSTFRRTSALLMIDLKSGRVARVSPADERADRMEYRRPTNEIWLSLPVESRLARYDADSLELKGYLKSIFGVRVMAIDEQRGLILLGSFTTGRLAVYDMKTWSQVNSFYLGPWLRTILLNPEAGLAYVTSNGALFEVKYVN